MRRGLVVNIAWFLIHASGRRAGFTSLWTTSVQPARLPFAYIISTKYHPVSFCANAKKSRPKTLFLKGERWDCIYRRIYIFSKRYILQNVYQKASIFIMRRGLAVNIVAF